jgi:hypothetical protein
MGIATTAQKSLFSFTSWRISGPYGCLQSWSGWTEQDSFWRNTIGWRGREFSACCPRPARMNTQTIMEPVWVRRAVVAAIEGNKPHVISHPNLKPAFDAWIQELDGAFGAPADPDYRR